MSAFWGKSLARPGIIFALGLLGSGQADVLAAVQLDRISRSVYDVASLMQCSIDEDWALVAVRGRIDTSTAMGRAYVHMAALFAELERAITSARTKAGMAQGRSEGVHLGRRTSLPLPVIQRIRAERAAGRSYSAIARGLTSEEIPTATGRAVWQISSVQSALTVNTSPSPAPSVQLLKGRHLGIAFQTQVLPPDKFVPTRTRQGPSKPRDCAADWLASCHVVGDRRTLRQLLPYGREPG